MSEDIVARMRSEETYAAMDSRGQLWKEAADEIERLRHELWKMELHLQWVTSQPRTRAGFIWRAARQRKWF